MSAIEERDQYAAQILAGFAANPVEKAIIAAWDTAESEPVDG